MSDPIVQITPFGSRRQTQDPFLFCVHHVDDYRRTQFGGWSFAVNDPVFPREQGRFARHADGRVEEAPHA